MNQNPDAYLLRFGELALKGRNRDKFVDDLVKIVKPRIKPLGAVIQKRHKKIVIVTQAPPEAMRKALAHVFGVTGISPIWRVDHDFEGIARSAWELLKPHADSNKTFAIRARRPFKKYPLNSMELQLKLADYFWEQGLRLKVNLKKPQLELGLSIEHDATWLYLETWPGLGGLPVSRFNKHGLLLSGGIDSPVAGNMIQKRAGSLEAIYFHTPPFTVEAARDKVVDLAEVLARYQNNLTLHVVNFTQVMKTLRAQCQEKFMVVLSRRFMMRVATKIMQSRGGMSLITGESLGQVASQTIENIGAVNEGVPLPILRPLIGMDKQEIISIARRIGTYETSILPFDDCCSLFAPKEPATKANLKHLHHQENQLDIEAMVQQAVEDTEMIEIESNFET